MSIPKSEMETTTNYMYGECMVKKPLQYHLLSENG